MMQGAFVLTLASFVAKILSAIYRVPYQNFAGDVGFYVYQQVYPIYGLAMTLALTGLPQFISKYVAEQKSLKEQKQALNQLYPLLSGLGLALWGLTFFSSRLWAVWMGDVSLTPLIKVVSFTFLMMPYLSLIRGSFQGQLQMVPTAISQVVEQLLRVTVILIAAWSFKQFGWSVYQTGVVAMSGAVAGGGMAVLILWYYQKKLSGYPLRFQRPQGIKNLSRRILLEGGLMTIYSGYLIFFQLVDSFTIKKALESYGLNNHAAQIAKGVYDRGQPLVQLGLVVALALSSSFLPLLTRYLSKQEQQLFVKTSQTFLRLTCGIAAACSVGLALLLPYVNYTLFKDYQGNLTLVLFVFAIFLMALIQAYQSIAQSQNTFRSSFLAAGCGFGVKIVTTIYFTRSAGTVGASLATLVGLFVTLLILHCTSQLGSLNYLRHNHFAKKLTGCLAGMLLVLLAYYGIGGLFLGGTPHRILTLMATLVGVVLGGSTFIFLAIQLKLLTIREWLMLPFGKKILRFKQK